MGMRAAGVVDTTRGTLHFADHARRVTLAPTVNVRVSAAAELRRLRSANTALQVQLVCLPFEHVYVCVCVRACGCLCS